MPALLENSMPRFQRSVRPGLKVNNFTQVQNFADTGQTALHISTV